jgi:hypothetical protein
MRYQKPVEPNPIKLTNPNRKKLSRRGLRPGANFLKNPKLTIAPTFIALFSPKIPKELDPGTFALMIMSCELFFLFVRHQSSTSSK